MKLSFRKIKSALTFTKLYHQKGTHYSQYSFVTWYGDKGRTTYKICQARLDASMVYHVKKSEDLK